MAFTTVNISFISQNRGVYSSDFHPKKLSSRICPSEFSLQFNRRSWSTLVTGASFSEAKTGLSLSPSDVDVDADDGDGNPPSSIGWSEFAKRVSGEWDGFGAEFSNEGKAIELPESVVPEAYREWEVKVFDWQTQCPTLAEPEQQHFIQCKSIQLLPTVGCEADAATRYSIDERKVGVEDGDGDGVRTSALAFAYQSSGCYVAVWSKHEKLELELEYCLINPQDFESRVRIIQVVRTDEDNTKMVIESIRVFREQWYGPFRNGEQLGGCAIRDSAFASTPPMTASQLAGVWQGSKAVATFATPSPNNGIFQELLQDKVQNSVRDGCNEILLPKHLWCSFKQNKNNGENLSEVGWLLDSRHAITSGCIFSSTGKLKEISVALETKGPEDV
ncbi:hypothetical protein L6164_037733 [Bauhinia variegata]|uniref:Uncharacterized protein n=1 Tax=Bauhinia variegata TaxID=167791 RepID=A0ACB9KL46_BAUVA|nr:hypothetical protein L6164_037733 [Bauhinia variegata]